MKLIYCPQILPTDAPPHLHLEPESPRDHETLTKLLKAGHAIGHGREPRSTQIIHIQIQLSDEQARKN